MIAAFTDNFPQFLIDVATIAGPWFGTVFVVDWSVKKGLEFLGL